MAKAVYIGETQQYRLVEYLQSSGTQYINTGFTPNQNTRVVCEFKRISRNASGSAAAVFGARYAKNDRDFTFWGYLSGGNNIIGGNYGNVNYQINYTEQERILVDKNKNVTTINGTTVTNATSTFTCPGNMFIFSTNKNGTADSQMGSIRLYYCKIYDNGVLIRDFVPAIDANGAYGLLDKINNKFYVNSGTGTFTVGQDTTIYQVGVAKKVRKAYIGINGIAKKIKNVYIGIGGVARPCWPEGKFTYYGAITSLSDNKYNLASAAVGNYALFAGGGSAIEIYNASLTRTTGSLSVLRTDIGGVSIGNYALFAGGNYYNTVDAYDASLTRTNPAVLSSTKRWPAATAIGDYALIAGGEHWDSVYQRYTDTNTVDVYNKSLTKSTAAQLSAGKRRARGASNSNYALIGYGDSGYVMDAYNTSLTKSSPANLSLNMIYTTATSVGEYVLFAGGYYFTTRGMSTNIVDTYNNSLTKSTAPTLSNFKYFCGSASNGTNALIAGGINESSSVFSEVDCYNETLTRTSLTNLSLPRSQIAGIFYCDYILFAGGTQNGYSGTNTVDAYILS